MVSFQTLTIISGVIIPKKKISLLEFLKFLKYGIKLLLRDILLFRLKNRLVITVRFQKIKAIVSLPSPFSTWKTFHGQPLHTRVYHKSKNN